MERPYEQIRRMVKLFEYNRLKLRFRNEDERARFIDGWAEHFCETDDAEWNIAVTIMTARRREPNFYNMEKALREAQGIRRERRLQQATQKTVKFTILTLSLSRTRIGRLLLRSTRTKQVLR